MRIRVERATLAAITLYGLVLRTRALAIESPHPLRPDAQVYRALARLLPTPYETGIREPGWPWLIRIWSELFGPSDAAQRTLTVMLSTALIPILWWLGRALTGRASVGLFGALLVASSDALVLQSPAGLRLESWTVALAVFAVAVYGTQRSPRRTWWLLTVSAGAATLINLGCIAAILPLIAYGAWRGRLGVRRTATIYLAVLIMLVPNFIHEARTYGDPFYSSNVHAIYYRNHEFVKYGHGCRGCPTLSEYHTSAYTGSKVTWVTYIFGMHTLPVVAQRFGSGLTRVFLSTDPIYRWRRGQLVRILFVLGIGTLLLRRGRRDLLPFPILAVGGTAFVVPLHGFDWRLVYHVAPFIYLLAAIGLVGATDGLRLLGSWLYRRGQPALGSR